MTAGVAGRGTRAEISLGAVDLGASSGRVVHGRVGPGVLQMRQVCRFRNGPVTLPDGLYWDILGLCQDILAGIGGRRVLMAIFKGSPSTPGPWTTGSSTPAEH